MKKKKKQEPTNPDTLTIFYTGSSDIKPESFKGIKNPDKIISQRNARNISHVLYGGKPFDISKHLKLYPEQKKKETI